MLQYFKHYLNPEYATYYQSAALVLFVIFFSAMVYFIINKPKKYYNSISDLPFEDENKSNNLREL